MDSHVPFAGIESRNSVDYMLRTVQQNFVQLTMLADQKANILIGVGIIVITLTMNLGMGSTVHPALLVLLFFVTGSVIVALLALIPRTCGQRLEQNPDTGNPLYFGAFARMSLDDYARHIEKLLQTDAGIYRAIVRDIYLHGTVLNRKYKYLRLSYILFLTGIISAALVFLYNHYPNAA